MARSPSALPDLRKLEDANVGFVFTYREVALILWRAPKTIKNLVCKHRIPTQIMVLARKRGQHKSYRTVVDRDGLRRLKEIIHGQESLSGRRRI